LQGKTDLIHRDRPVSAIIPAYNEAEHISSLLDVLCKVRAISEIIVVDDASTDDTAQIVRTLGDMDARILLASLPANLGKGGAMASGAQASQNDLILFLDADLIHLETRHVLALIEPVQSGRSCMSLGLFKGGRLLTDWSHRLAPYLSGQRCLRWSAFRDTPELAAARWGAEVALSLYAWQNRLPVQIVPLVGVTHIMRPEKIQLASGLASLARMWLDIGKYLFRHFAFGNRPSLYEFLRSNS